MSKRDNYISWDTYFMGVALLSAKRSKDPRTQVGALIANNENKIVSIGYNGFPRGISDDTFPWDRDGEFLDTKYPYVVHAEVNAVLNSTTKLDGSRIYVTLFPCNECAKIIIQSGIKEVIYLSDEKSLSLNTIASKRMFDAAGVKYHKFNGDLEVDVLLKN